MAGMGGAQARTPAGSAPASVHHWEYALVLSTLEFCSTSVSKFQESRYVQYELSRHIIEMTEHAVVQGRCKVQTKNYRWRDAKEGGDDSAESKPVLNIELEYEVRGNDGDPAVLMIHG